MGKPVLFTEVGYRSTADSAVEPWIWRSDAPVNNELQATLYEAMFQTFWHQPLVCRHPHLEVVPRGKHAIRRAACTAPGTGVYATGKTGGEGAGPVVPGGRG